MKRKGNAMIIGILLIFILVSGSLVFHFWLGPKIFLKQVDTAHGIIDQTYTAQNAIYNYEWFKVQYEKIQATEIQIDNTYMTIDDFKETYGNATSWDFTTKQEYSRLRTTLLGQQNHYESLVADYNARSKQAHRSVFKDSLPYNIDKKLW